MKNSWVLAWKDLTSYFRSWTGVLACFFFLVIAGVFLSLLVISFAHLSMEASRGPADSFQGLGLTRFVFGSFFLNIGTILIFLVPILSMRAFAEERRHQTLELLFTYPFSDFEIVWGKYLGMIFFFQILTLPILFFVWFVHGLGLTLDWGPIAFGFLGFWLLGCAYLSLGLFISSISENQVISAIVTFGCLLIFWILEWVAGVADGSWAHFFAALSPIRHYRDFTFGIFDMSDFVYFCFFNLYFLFLTLRAIETRNWKG
ncbi:MAG: ABC transporter permease subunit [Candidatus Omnitrophica bacterium]|nr:ABC transporter permease subunit [Candidatus Omnitrophota bacterium]